MDIISIVWVLDIIFNKSRGKQYGKIGNEKDEDVELLLRYVDPSEFHLY